MVKRCIYCNYELEDGSVIDICETCMYKVWGAKMAGAIVNNMKRESEKGNLDLGRVGDARSEKITPKKLVIEEEMIEAEEIPFTEEEMIEAEEVLEVPIEVGEEPHFEGFSL